jgi:lysophospholipase L1-like esterase
MSSRRERGVRVELLLLVLFALLAGGGCQKITNHPPRGDGPIVAFGDSLTSGVGAEEAGAYPDFLAKEVGEPVLNRGVSGDTTEDGLNRLQKDVLDSRPRMVIVWLGANDVLRQLSEAHAVENLTKIVDAIQAQGALVVLVGVPDAPFRPSLNDGVKRLAEERGCVYVPNPLRGILIDPELKSDPIHPNSRGYERVAARIAKKVKIYARGS